MAYSRKIIGKNLRKRSRKGGGERGGGEGEGGVHKAARAIRYTNFGLLLGVLAAEFLGMSGGKRKSTKIKRYTKRRRSTKRRR